MIKHFIVQRVLNSKVYSSIVYLELETPFKDGSVSFGKDISVFSFKDNYKYDTGIRDRNNIINRIN